MAYKKTIVCLANSRKMSGRCVAGKELRGRDWGAWLRPISGRSTEELSEEERRYEDGLDPKVGDVIRLQLLEPRPHTYQQENHLVDPGVHWKRLRRSNWAGLVGACDEVSVPLWRNGFSSSKGVNDRVPAAQAEGLRSSLYLVGPLAVDIIVQPEWEGKRGVRVRFVLAGEQYKLKATDPIVERQYLARRNGSYPVPTALLCVSLGEVYEGHAYKLVATVITPEIDEAP